MSSTVNESVFCVLTFLAIVVMVCIGYLMYQYLTGGMTKSKQQTPYDELIVLKDRMFKDVSRMEELLGHEQASMTIRQILMEFGI